MAMDPQIGMTTSTPTAGACCLFRFCLRRVIWMKAEVIVIGTCGLRLEAMGGWPVSGTYDPLDPESLYQSRCTPFAL